DVRAIYEAGRGISGDHSLTAAFFREEYELIRRIHRYPKPYVAIIDGITMGGGAGVSVNGAYRVATERTMLAMPETGIGLFPDVGATRFLNLCPGRIGCYLGLSGARVGAADALYCRFATHFVPRERVPALIAALTGRDFAIEEALALEYRLTQHVMAGHDFYEGVRAVLVDKDQQPRWDPPTLAGVDEAMVDSYFAPLGEAELRFD